MNGRIDSSKDNKREGKLFILSGPSGTGKGTVVKQILKTCDNVALSVSMTTRASRRGEVHGESYYFVSQEEFEKIIDKDGFLEYAKVYEHYYGTPREKVMQDLDAGRDVLLEIDIQGAMKVKRSFPDGIFIFLLPPSLKELRRRIEARATDAQDVIDLRMSKAAEEIRYLPAYDYYVINDDLTEAVEKVKSIFSAEHQRVDQTAERIMERYKEAD
ncbi:MAG: guanylate kinase [Eubacteriales bacterium]|nr:guanylate kinase [Eubacteriales bacterium]